MKHHLPASLVEVVDRTPLAASEASVPVKLPWNDPEFSRRMLAEHLDQRHDRASRRLATVDRHVDWIMDELLGGRPGSVLDVGCGPGLYTERLAERGCSCVGIDFSPAAIAYAGTVAAERALDCTYLLADVETVEFGTGFDLAMIVFGELNTFDRSAATDLVLRVRQALGCGGRLLVEAHRYEFVREAGRADPTWYTSRGGLFSAQPHLVLMEHTFDERSTVARTRYQVVDAGTAAVEVYGEQLTAYTDDDYREMLTAAGFGGVRFMAGLGDEPADGMCVVAALVTESADSRFHSAELASPEDPAS